MAISFNAATDKCGVELGPNLTLLVSPNAPQRIGGPPFRIKCIDAVVLGCDVNDVVAALPWDVDIGQVSPSVIGADHHPLPQTLEDAGLFVDTDVAAVIGEERGGGYFENAVQCAARVSGFGPSDCPC